MCWPALRETSCSYISQLETMKLPEDMEDGHNVMSLFESEVKSDVNIASVGRDNVDD